jgi:AcrR family transcriptional regulator
MGRSTRNDSTAGRRVLIEDTAIRLFSERGYCAVGLREIAQEAGISVGNIYNHFAKKEPLFAAVVERLYADLARDTEPIAHFLATAHFPDDAEELGRVVQNLVERHRAYLTLVYVDIAEFGGSHVRPHYQHLAASFRAAITPRLAASSPLASWVDPGVALALLYLQFASHFVIERLMGATGHLGLDDAAAVRTIARMFLLGVRPRPGSEGEPP